MEKDRIDRMFVGALRTNEGPIHISINNENFGDITLPYPDKRLMFEMSVAINSYLIRREKQLNNK